MAEKKTTDKANNLDKAIKELEALPHLNYAEAKDKLIAVLKLPSFSLGGCPPLVNNRFQGEKNDFQLS